MTTSTNISGQQHGVRARLDRNGPNRLKTLRDAESRYRNDVRNFIR